MIIYIIHYKKLKERKKYLLDIFEKYNIKNFEFIENYDRDNITDENIELFDKNFSKIHIAICLSHFYAYKKISEENHENSLIIEDDVIINENFFKNLNNYIKILPYNYDMVFIGDGCNLHIDKNKILPNCVMYKRNLDIEYGTRCTDSYIVSKKCANKIINYLNNNPAKICEAIDWWLNYYFKNNTEYNIYWAEPTIISQGSGNIYEKSY